MWTAPNKKNKNLATSVPIRTESTALLGVNMTIKWRFSSTVLIDSSFFSCTLCFVLFFSARGPLCPVCGCVCRSWKAEESNVGGSFPGSCRGAHPSGPGDVHCVRSGNGWISQGQQDLVAHGGNSEVGWIHICSLLFTLYIQRVEVTDVTVSAWIIQLFDKCSEFYTD